VNENMKKKIIGIFVCTLLISTVLPVTGDVMLDSSLVQFPLGNTLYVGGSGPGNYTKIQDAVNDSENGDTVYVFDDLSPYYERVQINTSISLIGEDRNTTIIDAYGGGVVIFISSDNVSIKGFTLQNSSRCISNHLNGFNFCNISDNMIIDNEWGIRTSALVYNNNNIIEGNTFFNNTYWTISVRGSNNMISGNIIDNPPGTYLGPGVGVGHGSGNNISGNTIKKCETGVSIGGDNNIVLNNVISSCHRDGIYIYESSNNTIIGNNISYSLWYWGIEITKDSNDNIIYHNNLIYNKGNAVGEGNNIWDDGEYGNYWSDYEDRYPDAKKKKQESIWDTPYEISGNNKDMCPLIKQWPDSVSKPVQMSDNERGCNDDIGWNFPITCLILKLLFEFIASHSPFPVPLMCHVIIFIAGIFDCSDIP